MKVMKGMAKDLYQGHMTRYYRDRRRVFSAARQRRQLNQHEHWDSDSVSDYGHDPESNYHVIEVIHCTLDAIQNAANQDLHLVAHLL
ncbi:hypothetical protein TNCV_4194911 [Trichonephila clavipes]|nr:hypothetical protein TNCV_4194911 [Trichonephila clavipes]